MKIIVKNLKSEQFPLEIDPTQTVGEIKQKIQEEQKIAVETQKLVCVGKVMQDDKTIEEYQLKEGGFLVLMTMKPKVKKEKKPEPTSTPAAQPSTTPATGGGMGSAPAQPAPTATTTPPPAPTPPAQPSQATQPAASEGSGIMRGEELEKTLQEMQSMGFPRDECMRALRAAFYDPNRAVDYLLNGIPEEAQMQQQQPGTTSASGAAPGGGAGAGSGTGAEGVDLSAFQNNPMMNDLRQRLARDPQFMQTFLAGLAQSHPQVFQAISQNPDMLRQLLMGGGGDGGEENDPPGTIRVTPEEKDAIERLAGLGFPKHRAIEAFFACDKNEEWAANYLFENCQADDNYEEQVVQDESRAEYDQQNPDAAQAQQPGGDAPMQQEPAQPAQPANPPAESDNMQVDQPAGNNPPAENAPAQNQPDQQNQAEQPNQNQPGNQNNEDEDDGSCL